MDETEKNLLSIRSIGGEGRGGRQMFKIGQKQKSAWFRDTASSGGEPKYQERRGSFKRRRRGRKGENWRESILGTKREREERREKDSRDRDPFDRRRCRSAGPAYCILG